MAGSPTSCWGQGTPLGGHRHWGIHLNLPGEGKPQGGVWGMVKGLQDGQCG